MADVLSISDIQQSFAAFSEANGASADFAYTDDQLMIARCVLPLEFEVNPGDALKGGIAVRATIEEVEVRPYLLRQVCTNGMISMRSVSGTTVATSECTTTWLDESFAAAASHEALAVAASGVRQLARASFDRAFLIATVMRQLRGFDKETVREMLRRMILDGSTGYSLLNAITSVARDTRDPQTRWRLEAAGGGIVAIILAGPGPREGTDALDLANLVQDRDRDLQLA